MNQKRKSGGAAPYGFRRAEEGFELHPDEAPIRKLIFELFLKHRKKLTVANALNQKGYRTRSGAQFSDSSISRFLTDPIVKGHHRDNYKKSVGGKRYRTLKSESERPYPPLEAIIDEDTWNQVDDILHAQKKKPARKTLNGIFGGLLTCTCGAEMHHPHGRKAYFCKSCENRIEVETINAIFAKKLSDFKINADKLDSSNRQSEAANNIEILKKEKERTEFEMEKLYDLYISGSINKDRFAQKNEPLESRHQQIGSELDALFATTKPKQTENNTPSNLSDTWHNLTESSKKELANLITHNIEVGISKIKITYTVSPSFF